MVSVYRPNPLYIPDDVSIERVAPPGIQEEPYDRRAIFYDVIVSKNGRDLVCVGPPFFNLGHPREAYLDRSKLSLAVYEPTHLATTRVAITSIRCPALGVGEKHFLRLVFDHFEATYEVNFKEHRLDGPAAITMSTLQRDNDPQWIQDWCIWHHAKHDVSRIVIYDNGSANFREVKSALSKVIGPQIVLVPWKHPFGQYALKFPQTTALNHCRLLFARDSQWCINLDVDEYLQNEANEGLSVLLERRTFRRRAIVYFRGYIVPFLVDGNPARCFDSNVRNREFARERKYIYQPAMTLLTEVHSAIEAYRPLYEAWKGLRRLAMKTLNKIPSLKRAIRRVALGIVGIADARRARKSGTTHLQRIGGYLVTLGDSLFFFHFRALNTGWKIPRHIVEVEEDDVIVDSRITDMRAVIDAPSDGG